MLMLEGIDDFQGKSKLRSFCVFPLTWLYLTAALDFALRLKEVLITKKDDCDAYPNVIEFTLALALLTWRFPGLRLWIQEVRMILLAYQQQMIIGHFCRLFLHGPLS